MWLECRQSQQMETYGASIVSYRYRPASQSTFNDHWSSPDIARFNDHQQILTRIHRKLADVERKTFVSAD